MPNTPFDPALPRDNSPLSSAEMRAQLNALAGRIAALEQQMGSRATMPTLGEFDPGFNDPPTTGDLENVRGYFNTLVQQLEQQ
jgi:hypothetical protein